MNQTLFITGTDTGAGKTILSLLLMRRFYRRGLTPFYLKPAQTGCRDPYDTDGDAQFIYRHVPELQGKDPADSVVYCFRWPEAPYFAARREGAAIDLEVIRQAVAERQSSFYPVIVEGAGGLMVPVTDTVLVIDLIEALQATPVIAARAGLGTINHTVLSIEALLRRGIQPAGVVFMNHDDPPVDAEMVRQNAEAVERITGVRVSGVIGRINDFSAPDSFCDQALENLFALSI